MKKHIFAESLKFNIMKNFYLAWLLLAFCCLFSCSKEDTTPFLKGENENTTKSPDSVTMTEGEMVLGEIKTIPKFSHKLATICNKQYLCINIIRQD